MIKLKTAWERSRLVLPPSVNTKSVQKSLQISTLHPPNQYESVPFFSEKFWLKNVESLKTCSPAKNVCLEKNFLVEFLSDHPHAYPTWRWESIVYEHFSHMSNLRRNTFLSILLAEYLSQGVGGSQTLWLKISNGGRCHRMSFLHPSWKPTRGCRVQNLLKNRYKYF